jgi:hypothetical protein
MDILRIPEALASLPRCREGGLFSGVDRASAVSVLETWFADVRYAVADDDNELLQSSTYLTLVLLYCDCMSGCSVRDFVASVHAIMDGHVATRLMISSRIDNPGRDLGVLDILPSDVLRRIFK